MRGVFQVIQILLILLFVGAIVVEAQEAPLPPISPEADTGGGSYEGSKQYAYAQQLKTLETKDIKAVNIENYQETSTGFTADSAETLSFPPADPAIQSNDLNNIHLQTGKTKTLTVSSAGSFRLPEYHLQIKDIGSSTFYVDENNKITSFTIGFPSKKTFEFNNPLSKGKKQFNDSNNDGLSDRFKKNNNLDINKKDTDGDGLTDYNEVMLYGTNPKKKDKEIVTAVLHDPSVLGDVADTLALDDNPYRDTDNDGVSDLVEYYLGTDYTKQDTDGDGLNDGYELSAGLPVDKPTVVPGAACLDCLFRVHGNEKSSFDMSFGDDSISFMLTYANLSLGNERDVLDIQQDDVRKQTEVTLKKRNGQYILSTENANVVYQGKSFTQSARNPYSIELDLNKGYQSLLMNTPTLYTYEYHTAPQYYKKNIQSAYDVVIPKESWTQSFQIQNPRDGKEQELLFKKTDNRSYIDLVNNIIHLNGKLKYRRINFAAGPQVNGYIAVAHVDQNYYTIYEGLEESAEADIHLNGNEVSITASGNVDAAFDDLIITQEQGQQYAEWLLIMRPPVLQSITTKNNPIIEKKGIFIYRNNVQLVSKKDNSKTLFKKTMEQYASAHPTCISPYKRSYHDEDWFE